MSWVTSQAVNESQSTKGGNQFGDFIVGGDPASVVALKGIQTIPLAVWGALALVAIVYLKTRKKG